MLWRGGTSFVAEKSLSYVRLFILNVAGAAKEAHLKPFFAYARLLAKKVHSTTISAAAVYVPHLSQLCGMKGKRVGRRR